MAQTPFHISELQNSRHLFRFQGPQNSFKSLHISQKPEFQTPVHILGISEVTDACAHFRDIRILDTCLYFRDLRIHWQLSIFQGHQNSRDLSRFRNLRISLIPVHIQGSQHFIDTCPYFKHLRIPLISTLHQFLTILPSPQHFTDIGPFISGTSDGDWSSSAIPGRTSSPLHLQCGRNALG